MSNCLNCKKELEQIEGKRAKIFCNSTCRSNFWQKESRKNASQRTETAQKDTKPKNTGNVSLKEETTEIKPENNKSDIEKQIIAIKAEKIPKERDTVYGRKVWNIDQQKRIKELETKL